MITLLDGLYIELWLQPKYNKQIDSSHVLGVGKGYQIIHTRINNEERDDQ
jgi:hypothetical protein